MVDFHLPFICDRMETPSKAVSPEFLSCLLNYPWPGNVRELVNALERSVSAAWDELTLFPLHLPAVIRIHLARTAAQAPDVAAASYGPGHVPEMSSLDETRIEAINQAEEKYLRRLLEHTGGKIEEAYRIAGLSRSRLYALLKKHHIKTGR